MRKGLAFLICLVMVTMLGTSTSKCKEAINLHACASILIDRETGRVLYGENHFEKRAMASTTKIMTTIVALENGNVEDLVAVSSKAAAQPKVKLYIKKGEKYRLQDLLYALMLQSSNDVAVAIAEHIGGDVETFCDMMTAKAQEIGAYNTSYKTPNGLDAVGHFSTAYDLALITRYALENEDFVRIINTPAWQISKGNGNTRDISVNNKNRFLNSYSGAYGVKTGFTSQAGYCFVGAAKQNDMDLIAVVLGSGWYPYKTWKWMDTSKLMNYGFRHYAYEDILTEDSEYKDIPIDRGMAEMVATYIDGELRLPLSQKDEIDIKHSLFDTIEAPITKDTPVGIASVYLNDELYDSYYIRTSEDVLRQDFWYYLKRLVNEWISNSFLNDLFSLQ